MKGWRELKKNKKKGVSMAVVVCISAFFVAFSIAMVYTAGLLTAQANSKIEQEQSNRLAKSFSEVLEKELTKYKIKSSDDKTFYGFLNNFLDSKKYLKYNPDKPEKTTYHYQWNPETADEKKYGTIKIALQKEENQDDQNINLKGGEFEYKTGEDYTETISDVKKLEIMQYTVTVEVTVGDGDSAYTYTTEYYRKEQYNPIFYHNGEVISWNENDKKWKQGDDPMSGTEHKFGGDTDKITYKFTEDRTTSCQFESRSGQEEAESN